VKIYISVGSLCLIANKFLVIAIEVPVSTAASTGDSSSLLDPSVYNEIPWPIRFEKNLMDSTTINRAVSIDDANESDGSESSSSSSDNNYREEEYEDSSSVGHKLEILYSVLMENLIMSFYSIINVFSYLISFVVVSSGVMSIKI